MPAAVLAGHHLERPEEIMRDVPADFEVRLEKLHWKAATCTCQ
jgi:hypothetical protein